MVTMYFWNSPEVRRLPSLPSHLMVPAIPAGQNQDVETELNNHEVKTRQEEAGGQEMMRVII